MTTSGWLSCQCHRGHALQAFASVEGWASSGSLSFHWSTAINDETPNSLDSILLKYLVLGAWIPLSVSSLNLWFGDNQLLNQSMNKLSLQLPHFTL